MLRGGPNDSFPEVPRVLILPSCRGRMEAADDCFSGATPVFPHEKNGACGIDLPAELRGTPRGLGRLLSVDEKGEGVRIPVVLEGHFEIKEGGLVDLDEEARG